MIQVSTDLDEEAEPQTQAEAKWGEAVRPGRYQILPDALLRGQHLLKLSATDVVVIANLNQVWWFSDRRPYLQPQTIAKRMGISERSVQRSFRRLRTKGFLHQMRERQKDGTMRYYHDLSGLRTILEQLSRRDVRYWETLRSERKTEEVNAKAENL